MENIKTLDKKTVNRAPGFDNLSSFLILALGFLVPVFFLPLFNISPDVSKSVLISTFIAVAFFLWLIARLKDGRFIFPKSIVLVAGATIPALYFLSSVFSGAATTSLIGLGYEVGTFSSIIILYILMFLSAIFFQKQKRIFYLYSAILLSAGLVFIYHLVRYIFLFFGLPFGEVFLGLPENLIGKWADMSIFFGLAAVLSLITLELVSLKKNTRFILIACLAVSLLVMALVNMQFLWIVVGLFSLVVFVYAISFGSVSVKKDEERKIPTIPFAVLLISLFFVLAGGVIGESIYSISNISPEILRPSLDQTLEVARGALSDNPILGSGPNRFVNQWLLYKPDSINNSILWNTDFSTGVGLVPSFMISTGLVGILAWLLFFGAFLYRGAKSVFWTRVEAAHHYVLFSSFLAALYLWIFSVFYVPNITIIFLAFLMTGVFVASLAQAKVIENYNFSFLEDPRIGFVSVLVLILLIISSLAGGYLLFQKFLSVGYFQRSIVAFRVVGDLNSSEQNIVRAIKLNKNDLYYRTIAEMNLAHLGNILSVNGVSEETIRAEFQSISQAAVKNALTATEIDKTNYLNWVSLARVYESLIPFGAPEGFYESAKQSYAKALSFNPKSPKLVLSQARLEIAMGNKEAAKAYIAQALSLKNNYTEAIFLLAQIQADDGELDAAIQSVEVASIVAPNDMGVFFQLGFLRYRNEQYEGAIAAFGRAVELNPNYSNAKYFLGLSYYEEGYRSKAIEQFEQIGALDPGNSEVEKILRNLKAGKRPLSRE